MKKKIILFLTVLILAGCATYKFQRAEAPYDKGYVVSKNDYTILEYTIGKDNSVPQDLDLAKARFDRRRKTVEEHYEKMGYIENRFKEIFWNPPAMLVKTIGGMLYLPVYAVSEYRSAHNPEYRQKIEKIEEEKQAKEDARKKELREGLNAYIQQDLATEPPAPIMLAKEESKAEEEKPEEEVEAEEQKPEEKVLSEIEPSEQQEVKIEKPKKPSGALQAIIVAHPAKGFSPLRVHFSGRKSKGRIVSYKWDFGDDDTSNKPSPVNTYWSGSFVPRQFTATLTVQDKDGNTDQASIAIEVFNK
jgi:hypothetical protein